VVHYRLDLPPGLRDPVTVDVKLRYRKFDTIYMQHVFGADYVNELPILTLATDRVTFPVAGGAEVESSTSAIDEWQRWNDYGIGLLRKAGSKTKGELVGAEAAFRRVEELGRPDGPLNLARVYLADGTVADHAVDALRRAAAFEPPAAPWTLAWLSGQVDKQNGNLDQAIAAFESLVAASGPELTERGFDFSLDYNLLNELGSALFERARLERGEARRPARQALLGRAAQSFERTLALDPENVTAHYNLGLIYGQLGDREKGREHLRLHQKYKPDDNARDRTIAIHRARNPAADHAAEAIVLYDLRRAGAFELDVPLEAAGRAERFVVQPPASGAPPRLLAADPAVPPTTRAPASSGSP
jgi:tetratricopeptide (TPR) repeat protein